MRKTKLHYTTVLEASLKTPISFSTAPLAGFSFFSPAVGTIILVHRKEGTGVEGQVSKHFRVEDEE